MKKKHAEKTNREKTGQGKIRENLKFAKQSVRFEAFRLIRNYRMTNINLMQYNLHIRDTVRTAP